MTGLLFAVLALGLPGCGGGPTEPSQRLVVYGIITVSSLEFLPTLVEIEGLVNGRSVGIARIPQGQRAKELIMLEFDDVPIRSGVNRVGVRIRERLSGPGPYFVLINVGAVDLQANRGQIARGDFEATRVVAAGEVVDFEFRVP